MSRLIDRALDWTATGVAGAGVIATLVAYDVVQRVAIRRGLDAQQDAVSRMARTANRIVGAIVGVHFDVQGREHVRPGRNYIIVSNHQSLFDISMTSDFLAPLQPRYVSKIELARGVPGVSYNLAHGGSALIDRKNADQAHEAIAAIGRKVKNDGWTVVIFPEGTRSKTGAMKPFRAAGLRTLIASAPGIEVLPLTISGGSEMFRNDLKPVVRNVHMLYRVHPPMSPPDPDDAAAFDAFIHRLESVIASALPGAAQPSVATATTSEM